MHRFFAQFILFCASSLLAPKLATATTIPTVPVGSAGNANDPLTGNLYGGVSYAYRIGTTEVTNAQYVDFLNAKATSDPLGLYKAQMGSNPTGGITQTGISGSFTYTTKNNMGNKPVNWISWYDAIRFANWLNNGQGAGDTETGAYTILGGTFVPSNANSITRNVGAMWFLPSENEWYKAAYYQPPSQGGDADNYWLYPTRSNGVPTLASANSVGDISNPGINVANCNVGADWNGQDGNVTTVGSAGPLSESFYGTSDQGGNVREWVDTLIRGSTQRGLRGGSFANFEVEMQATSHSNSSPNFAYLLTGFRVATVPEPGTAVLVIVGCALMWVLMKRFK